MSMDAEAATALCDAIVQGSFPQSEELLTADLSSNIISDLLAQISQTRESLSNEIKADFKDEEGSVGQWIAQAKRVQEDIARCKSESRRIVQEHQELQAIRDQANDYQRKVDLLGTEIQFTSSLTQGLQDLSVATQSLREVEECSSHNNPDGAATKLQEISTNPATKSKSRTAVLIGDLKDELLLKARFQLETKLNEQVVVRREQQEGSLEVRVNDHEPDGIDATVQALNSLGDGQDSTEPLTDKLKSLIVHPLRRPARLRLATYNIEGNTLRVNFGSSQPSIDLVLDFVLDFLGYLKSSFPKILQDATSKAVLPDLMDVLVTAWLNPELPTDLDMLEGLHRIEERVLVILKELESSQWQGQSHLRDWIEDIHRAWLNKRKAATLDAVRKAFAAAKGNLRQVERVERQVVSVTVKDDTSTKGASDDWDADWGDSNEKDPAEKPVNHSEGEDDDTDGWGFNDEETEELPPPNGGNDAAAEDNDAGDAWGWGDESPVATKKQPALFKDHPNGAKATQKPEQEITLTEVYSISEIPDHLIEIIGRDLSDAQAVLDTQYKSLDSASASRGLLALPTLALAMFRATAPSYYGASPSLTDIHRYNDALYIAERLRGMSTPPSMPSMDADIRALERFAKMAYSKEMETQRIIIWDLLEGAQGFTSCTQFPYSQEIENAVSSVIDRVRTLHATWKPILSTSALMQSMGSLVTMVVSKVISSIEEMDDISEPESQRLTAHCQRLATLEDLFLSTPPQSTSLTTAPHGEENVDAVPMTAVYVSNWLRFQYLINILESSLVDIKYLWTEGELSLEFSADEVVDLIKALFSESVHRRGAIAAIKGSRRSR